MTQEECLHLALQLFPPEDRPFVAVERERRIGAKAKNEYYLWFFQKEGFDARFLISSDSGWDELLQRTKDRLNPPQDGPFDDESASQSKQIQSVPNLGPDYGIAFNQSTGYIDAIFCSPRKPTEGGSQMTPAEEDALKER